MTYGNLRPANGDKIKLSGGGQLGGVHPAQTDGTHRTHTLGGAIPRPKEVWEVKSGGTLGGSLGKNSF